MLLYIAIPLFIRGPNCDTSGDVVVFDVSLIERGRDYNCQNVIHPEGVFQALHRYQLLRLFF